jgi:hypothetical protein
MHTYTHIYTHTHTHNVEFVVGKVALGQILLQLRVGQLRPLPVGIIPPKLYNNAIHTQRYMILATDSFIKEHMHYSYARTHAHAHLHTNKYVNLCLFCIADKERAFLQLICS